MFPYVEQPVLDFGFYRLEAFVVLVGLALVTEFQIVMRRAPSHGIDRAIAASLLGWAIALGIAGARVFEVVAYHPQLLIENPLALFQLWGGISSFGGMLGGLSGVFLVMRHRGMSASDMLRFVDCLLFALPFTLASGVSDARCSTITGASRRTIGSRWHFPTARASISGCWSSSTSA